MKRKLWLLVCIVYAFASSGAQADPNDWSLPFPGGESYSLSRGDQNGTHAYTNGAYAIDFEMPTGSIVCSPADGTITVFSGCPQNHYRSIVCASGCAGYGNYAILRTMDGYTVYLAHFSSISAKSGPIQKGDVIGLSGNTGNSSGPHLHFEVRNFKEANIFNMKASALKGGDVLKQETTNIDIDTSVIGVPVSIFTTIVDAYASPSAIPSKSSTNVIVITEGNVEKVELVNESNQIKDIQDIPVEEDGTLRAWVLNTKQIEGKTGRTFTVKVYNMGIVTEEKVKITFIKGSQADQGEQLDQEIQFAPGTGGVIAVAPSQQIWAPAYTYYQQSSARGSSSGSTSSTNSSFQNSGALIGKTNDSVTRTTDQANNTDTANGQRTPFAYHSEEIMITKYQYKKVYYVEDWDGNVLMDDNGKRFEFKVGAGNQMFLGDGNGDYKFDNNGNKIPIDTDYILNKWNEKMKK